jgi:hypothetical protein
MNFDPVDAYRILHLYQTLITADKLLEPAPLSLGYSPAAKENLPFQSQRPARYHPPQTTNSTRFTAFNKFT